MGNAGRRTSLGLLLTLVAGGLVFGGWKWREVRLYRGAMDEIQLEIDNARYGLAAKGLASVLARTPNSDEALFLLGLCEKERGQADKALDIWARIPLSSPFGPQAIQGRIEIQVQRGLLADTEKLVPEALEDRNVDGSGPGILLGPLYCQQGRLEEAERLVEAHWDWLNEHGAGASEKAIDLARLHIKLAEVTPSVDAIRAFLDQAARSAPEDDRVWLGRANLAIRTGAYDEAATLLDACVRRRPDDAPVWRARLKWAVASGRVAAAREALKHLPATESAPAEVQKLAAWFAFKRGDIESERRALERLIAADPEDFQAVDRLIGLALKDGQANQAAFLRQMKVATEGRQARYKKLYQRNQPSRDAAEIARLAGQLGRRFEAEVYLTVALAVDTDRDDLRSDLSRLRLNAETTSRQHGNLDEVLAPELEAKASMGS